MRSFVGLYIYSYCINGSCAMIASLIDGQMFITQYESVAPKEWVRRYFGVVRELLNGLSLPSLCTAQACNSFPVKLFFIFSPENSRE